MTLVLTFAYDLRWGSALRQLCWAWEFAARAVKVQFSRQSKSSSRSTLLLVGSGVLADTLAKHLATPEVEVLRTPRDRMFEALVPGVAHCVVLVGDAASERGAPLIREIVKRLGADAPLMVVVSAPQIGSLSPQPMPAGAALLTPEGGMVECARRLRAALDRLHGGALEQSSLQSVVDETSRKASGASATQKIAAGAPPLPGANPAAARPRQQTLLGPTAPVAPPPSTRIEVSGNGTPEANGGGKPFAVSAIAAVVSKVVAADQAQPIDMLWGESTPTVVARARPKQASTKLDLQSDDPELVLGEASVDSDPDLELEVSPPVAAPPPMAAPPPSRGREMSSNAKAEVAAPRDASVSTSAPSTRQRQPTLHGQAPLSLSALAGAGGAVGVEVRIKTASTSSMKKVTAPEPSGSLPPSAAIQSPAPVVQPVQVFPQPSASQSAQTLDSLSPVVMRSEASVEVSLSSLEPSAVAFSESAPPFPDDAEAPTPIAISIPARTEPEPKRAGLDGIAAQVRGLFPRFPAAQPDLDAPLDEAKPARQRRSAFRYVMAAVIVLALGGGAAATFKLMRPSENTQARTPAAAFGALAQAGPTARSQAKRTTLASTAKSENPDSAATELARKREREVAPPPATPSHTAQTPSQAPARSNPGVEAQPTAALPDPTPTEQPAAADVHARLPAVVSNALAEADLAPSAEPQVAPAADESKHAASVAAVADSGLQEADAEDSQSDAPAPNPAVQRAARLVDEGLSLAKQGRYGLAEASHLRALRVFPNYPRALAGLVRVHLARKDGSEALRWAKRLAARQPSRAQNHLLLGDAQALRGDAKAARRAWSKAARSGSATARTRLKSAKS